MADSGNKGEVTYEIRADDSYLESDLDAAEKKVLRASSRTGEQVEKSAKDTVKVVENQIEKVTETQKKSTEEQVDTETKAGKKRTGVIRELADYAKKAASETKKNVSEKVSGIAEVIKHPQKAVKSVADKSVELVKKASDDVAGKIKIGGERVIDTIFHPVEALKKGSASVKDKIVEHTTKSVEVVKKAADTILPVTAGTAKAIGASFLAAGTATVAIGATAVNGANELNQAMNHLSASTGMNREHMEHYQKVLENVYKNNYGESFEDIADAMATMEQYSISDMVGDTDELQRAVESGYALRDTFGYEIPETARTASTLMTQFGISADEAFDMIAYGAQNGLDFSGEMLDSINEYSVQFAKMGLGAEDMFRIMEKGAAAGAWNLDKIGDAIKEMSIRVIDGSDTTKMGFESIGLNADRMAERFAEGGESAKQAFQETIAALAAMEDPLEQNAAGVNLFGTMWEDLGPEVVTQLADIENGVYDMAGSMEQIKEVKYDDLGSMLEGLKRSVEMLIIPLGEQLIPVLSELIEGVLPLLQESLPPILELVGRGIEGMMPVIQEILPLLLSLFQQLMPVFQQILSKVLPVLIDLLQEILPVFGELISDLLPILVELFTKLMDPLLEIISALLPPLLELFDALLPILEVLIALLDPIISLFIGLLDPVVNLIRGAITPLIEIIGELLHVALEPLQEAIKVLGSIFAERLRGMMETAGEIFDALKQIFGGLIDFIAGIFTGDWERAWKGIVDIFDGIISGISAIFKIPINWIIDGINGFLDGLNGIKIPDWVPGVGGMSFNIPLIPRLKKGMNFVPSDYFPAYLDYGERVLTQQENMIYTALGGIEGMQELKRNINVTVENQNSDIDYDRMGEATADALNRAGLAVILDKRELGRVVREVQK